MVWQVARHGARSRVVGTAHFFPYHFRGTLARLIGEARVVLLEGPLDEGAMQRVVHAGRSAAQGSLFHALDAGTRLRLSRDLGFAGLPAGAPLMYRELFFGGPDQWLETELRGLKPWMAFFGLWSRFRRGRGGNYNLDLDAHVLAGRLGKALLHLETIDEQIAALEGIPLARIVEFLARTDWPDYDDDYVGRYLDGDLGPLIELARGFPTSCEAVIEQRDPILAERMALELERGGVCAFIGVTHCPGVLAALERAGFEVRR